MDYAEGGRYDFAKRETSFACEHENEDTARLLLSAARYPDIDMPLAVQQIEGRRTAREKWPSLLQSEDFLYPPRLNREQASSETAAAYKAIVARRHLACGEASAQTASLHIADLTGGMGVDSMAFADVCGRQAACVSGCLDYVERDTQLCTLMEHNCRALGFDNVRVHCADSMQWLASTSCPFDLIFIDPARRSATGRKVAAFEDCEPDILEHFKLLLSRCRWLFVKASPMIDVDLACRQLGCVAEVHVVAVKGECKEVLFLCANDAIAEPSITCVDLDSGKVQYEPDAFVFTRADEAAAVPHLADAAGRYLYIPGAAMMKGGAFSLIGCRYGLKKLGRNTHLYTSDERVGAFPGRVLEVVCEIRGGRRGVAAVLPEGRAHVLTRNYPVEASVLQRQLGLKEGGDRYVVATSIGQRRAMLLCTDAIQ